MIEMAVGQQDRFHVIRLEAEARETPADQPRLADKAGVEQHRTVGVHQQMAYAHDAADGVDTGIAHRAKFARMWRETMAIRTP